MPLFAVQLRYGVVVEFNVPLDAEPDTDTGHACCDHNESESYRPTNIICRHCVDQQTDSLVFSEVQSDHRE